MTEQSCQDPIEKKILRMIHFIDQRRYRLYQERMEWQELLEQIQAEKLQKGEQEVAGDE